MNVPMPKHPQGPRALKPEQHCILSLDLGTTTGWALRTPTGQIVTGTSFFESNRYSGGGMRFLRFTQWLDELQTAYGQISLVWFEEVRAHKGVDAAHVYGGLMGTLTAWCEFHGTPYEGVPVGVIKRHATGKGNASKDDVIAYVQSKGFKPKDDNEADAIALLHWAVETEGGSK